VIADPPSDPSGKPTYVADSFNIAVYLDDKYPAPIYPVVLPDGTRALQKVASDLFTYEVGYPLMSIVVPLIARPGFLDNHGREYFCRTREAWFGNLSDLAKSEPEKWKEIHKKWDEFGKKLDLNNGTNENGPFVMGDHISFADFAVGGMILWLRRAEGGDMHRWKEMSEWQGGRWARIWAETEKLEKDSTEVA
jgi:glutathione S-transferase